MIAEADEILTRTLRIVNRLHPAVPMPDISGPVLDWTAQRAFEASKRERERLFKRIKPMVEAKVRAVPSDEALRLMMGGSASEPPQPPAAGASSARAAAAAIRRTAR
jgi:hypothetical protein